MNLPARYAEIDHGPGGKAVRFDAPKGMIVAWDSADVAPAFEEMARAQAKGAWLAGYASYELGYVLMPRLADRMPQHRDTPLMAFGVFEKPRPAPQPPRAAAALTRPAPRWAQAEYARAFRRLHEYIGAGDVYQANLTFGLDAHMQGDAQSLYHALAVHQPVGYGALIDFGEGPVIASRSPELFFSVGADRRIETRPMKGTVTRGATPEADAEARAWLANDEKNRAENLMIVDLLRNDLSRVAQTGSVRVPRLFDVETYATVHQMVSHVTADLRPGTTLQEVFDALFPCGSVTGAPKLRAMEIIRELEDEARGVYCGAIGWAAPDGRACFNVAIRTLSIFPNGAVRLNAGGGIVWDSRADLEYEEALWKTRFTQLSPGT